MKVLSVINNDKDAVTKEYVDSKAGVTAVDPTSGPVETDFFIPTKTSELTNDSGFITEAALTTKQDTLVSGTNIKTINNQSLLGSGNISLATVETDPIFNASAAKNITSTDITNWNNKSDFSGSYNDLTDLPVPTDIRINNSSIISGGVANLGVLPDYNSSTNPLATMGAVSQGMNAIMDEVDKKQDTLVSGTNIKTINNESILGSGNINISGGGGTATDVQVNGTSITSSGVANLLTNSAYNSSSNKIATMTDVSNAVASKLDANWNADDSNGSIEWQEGESSTASKLITKVASNTNNNFSQTEITSDNMLLTSGVNGVQMNTSINMTPYAINITNQTTDGSITIDADLITLSGAAQIATVPDTNNSIVNKKYVDDIVGDIESLLGGI